MPYKSIKPSLKIMRGCEYVQQQWTDLILSVFQLMDGRLAPFLKISVLVCRGQWWAVRVERDWSESQISTVLLGFPHSWSRTSKWSDDRVLRRSLEWEHV